MRHTLSVLLQNEAGALSRVTDLFSTRGFNIESLNVAPTKDYEVSRLTLVTNGSDDTLEQIMKQLSKLVDVVDLRNMTGRDHIIRELVLFKLRLTTGTRAQLDELVAEFGGSILAEHEGHFTIEITSSGPRIDGFLESRREDRGNGRPGAQRGHGGIARRAHELARLGSHGRARRSSRGTVDETRERARARTEPLEATGPAPLRRSPARG